jgi:hypothetical protein
VSWPKWRLPLPWSAGPEGKPFYSVFLRRVIRIEPVQRERELITNPLEIATLESGRLPGVFDTYAWPVDKPPEPSDLSGDLSSYTMSKPFARAWVGYIVSETSSPIFSSAGG